MQHLYISYLKKIKDFLQRGTDTNRLFKSVKFDVNVIEYVAGFKALGVLPYLVTVPSGV